MYDCRGSGREWSGLFHGRLEDLEAESLCVGAQVVEKGMASLDEIFVARATRRQSSAKQEANR